jgi:hypothetical protein
MAPYDGLAAAIAARQYGWPISSDPQLTGGTQSR